MRPFLFPTRGHRQLFVHSECRDIQTAQRIDRDAVLPGLDAFEYDQIGVGAESARGEGLPFERVGLTVAEGSDRAVLGYAHFLLHFEPEDADHRHRVDPVVRYADDEGDALALSEPHEGLGAVERHLVDMVFPDAEEFLPRRGAVSGCQALLNELLGRVVRADRQRVADEFGFGKFQRLLGEGDSRQGAGGEKQYQRFFHGSVELI